MGIKISKQRHKPRITKTQIPWLVRGAIRSNNIETMQYLLTYPNDVNPSMVIDGVCPLNLAIELGRLQMVKILIKAGADIHVADSPRYPLHQAAIFGHSEIIEFLIKSGCCLATLTERRESCLHLIASQRSPKFTEAASVLIKYQIEPNILNDDGLSALHIASAQMIPIFCSFDRINMNILSEAGDSPLISATKDRKEAEVLELLKFTKFALEEKMLEETLQNSEMVVSETYESENNYSHQAMSRQNTKNYETSFYNRLKLGNHKRTSSSKSTNSTVSTKHRLNLPELMSRGLASVRANSTTSIQMNSVNTPFSNRRSQTPNENSFYLITNQSQHQHLNQEDRSIAAFLNSLNFRLSNWHNSNTMRKSSEFVSNKLFLSKSNHHKSCVPHYYSGLRINSNQKLNLHQISMCENNCSKQQMNNSFCSSLNTNCQQLIRRQESWNKNTTPHHPPLLSSNSKVLKNRQNSLCGASLLDVSMTNSIVPSSLQMLSASSSTKKAPRSSPPLPESTTKEIQYVDIDLQDKIGMTALILAAEAGTSGINILTALLNVGADLMLRDKMSMSALHYAAYVGALASVRVFFEYTNTKYPQIAINVRKKSYELLNEQDKYGRTPIYLATARGHKEVVNYLLSVGADLHIANYEKKSPLYISAYFGHLEIVNTLLRNGAKVDQADSHLKTPLYVATYHGRNDIVDLLLAAGANVNTTDKNGKTPLYIGVLHGNLALANKLLKAGAIINKPDHEGLGPLHMAVKFPKLDIPMIKLLLSYGCDPVNLAAFTRWLITHGIIPEECIERDEELRTWLHLEESSVRSLKRICRVEIQRALGHIDTMKSKIVKLPLPESLQAYVSMKAL